MRRKIRRWMNLPITETLNLRRLIRGEAQILFVHGAAVSGRAWGPWGDVFDKAGYPVGAIDLRGHGKSKGKEEIGTYGIRHYVDDVIAAVKWMRANDAPARKVILVGHSMGGLICQMAADELGDEYIAKLVLMASAPPRGIWLKGEIVRLALRIKYLRAMIFHKPLEALEDDLKRLDIGTGTDFQTVMKSLRAESGRALKEILFWRHKVSDILPFPVLVVAGMRDAVMPMEVQKKLAQKYGADMLCYPGGHLPLSEPTTLEIGESILSWISTGQTIPIEDCDCRSYSPDETRT